MNWTYDDAPIFCEECGVTIEEHSGYTIPQGGICNDCFAKLESRPTQDALDAALPSCPMCGSTDTEHFHVKRTWLNPAAPVI